MKQGVARFVLLLFSGLICLFMAEFTLRLVLDPVNFLLPHHIDDPLLRHRIAAGSGGHDDWGFRNPEVPERVDIVAIGDSQTYGNTAAASNSWPAWLARESGKSVYNMGMGGWGPLEYLHIARTRAFELKPKLVLVGLYLGNDIYDSSLAAYTVDQWESRRDPNKVDAMQELYATRNVRPLRKKKAESSATELRHWLRQNSVLYRSGVVSAGHWLRPFEVRLRGESGNDNTVIKDSDDELLTVLNLAQRLRALDMRDLRIQEGTRLLLEVLPELDQLCRENQARLVVVIIPTKARVVAQFAREHGLENQLELLNTLVDYERRATDAFEEMLVAAEIQHVSALDSLRALVGVEQIYPLNVDGHPRSFGYRAIARVVSRKLEELSTSRTRLSSR